MDTQDNNENESILDSEQVEPPDCDDSEEGLRLQVLHLAKDILQQKAVMRWETHKKCEDITIDTVIHEAQKLYNFIKGN